MTQDYKHPITPPPELVSKWCYEDGEEIKSSPRWFVSVCAKAAQWGADQELEACLNWLTDRERFPVGHEAIEDLKADRRPKSPGLKDQALDVLETLFQRSFAVGEAERDTIRRALEQLDD